MKNNLNKYQIERFSRQIILKNIGPKGQKKILLSKILIVGVGGLGCPAAESLVRAGIGTIGLIDNDIVNLSNIHRQSLFNSKDIKKPKVSVAAKKLKEINHHCLRVGNVVGDHTVKFTLQDESIEIHHKSFDRKIFANGAVLAAEWILNKEPGLYNMSDVLAM